MEKYTPVNNIFLLFIRDRLHNKRDACWKSASAANSLFKVFSDIGAVYEFLLQEDEMQHLASNLRGVDGAGHNNVLPFSQKVGFPLEKGLEVLKYLGIV